jgi:biopolymer transport protein ExbD
MNTRRNKGEPGPEVTLPITPMLDMTFQLLFFFIISFYIYKKDHPTVVIEGQMDLSLPTEAKEPKAATPDDTDIHTPSDPNAVLEDPLKGMVTLLVRAQDGRPDSIKEMVLRQPPREDVHLNDLDDLDDQLAALALKPEGTKQAIRIQGDDKLHWSVAIQVMDVCRRRDFQNIGFLSPNHQK